MSASRRLGLRRHRFSIGPTLALLGSTADSSLAAIAPCARTRYARGRPKSTRDRSGVASLKALKALDDLVDLVDLLKKDLAVTTSELKVPEDGFIANQLHASLPGLEWNVVKTEKWTVTGIYLTKEGMLVGKPACKVTNEKFECPVTEGGALEGRIEVPAKDQAGRSRTAELPVRFEPKRPGA